MKPKKYKVTFYTEGISKLEIKKILKGKVDKGAITDIIIKLREGISYKDYALLKKQHKTKE